MAPESSRTAGANDDAADDGCRAGSFRSQYLVRREHGPAIEAARKLLEEVCEPGWYVLLVGKVKVMAGEGTDTEALPEMLGKGTRVYVSEGLEDEKARGVFADGVWKGRRVRLDKPVDGWISRVLEDGTKVF